MCMLRLGQGPFDGSLAGQVRGWLACLAALVDDAGPRHLDLRARSVPHCSSLNKEMPVHLCHAAPSLSALPLLPAPPSLPRPAPPLLPPGC